MPGGSLHRLRISRHQIPCFTGAYTRTYSTGILQGDQLGPIQKDDHQTYRVRKDGKPLPLPPVLDPIVVKERRRWEQPKAKPNVETFTPFQKKLWENPYAHALASPVRQCRTTNLLLPSAFLLSLHPRLHPETSDPWLLPVGLTTASKHLGVPYRFLVRYAIAQRLGRKKRWRSGLYQRFSEKLGSKTARLVWREDMPELIFSLMQKNLANKLRWYFQHPGQLLPCPSPRPQDIKDIDDVSCVLFFDSLKTAADETEAKTEQIVEAIEYCAKAFATKEEDILDPHKTKSVTHKAPNWWHGPLVPQLKPRVRFPPLEFKTTGWRGSKVAVYSLTDLIGEERLGELVKGSKFEQERCLVVKRARHNVPLQLQLMQLQAYITKPGL